MDRGAGLEAIGEGQLEIRELLILEKKRGRLHVQAFINLDVRKFGNTEM